MERLYLAYDMGVENKIMKQSNLKSRSIKGEKAS